MKHQFPRRWPYATESKSQRKIDTALGNLFEIFSAAEQLCAARASRHAEAHTRMQKRSSAITPNYDSKHTKCNQNERERERDTDGNQNQTSVFEMNELRWNTSARLVVWYRFGKK